MTNDNGEAVTQVFGTGVPGTLVFGLIRDLLFVPKIRAAVAETGAHFVNFREQERLVQEITEKQPSLLVVDLYDKGFDLPELLKALVGRSSKLQVIGYYPHVEHVLAQWGRDAGLHHVVPRSKIVSALQERILSVRMEVKS